MKAGDPVEKIEPECLEELLVRIKPVVGAGDYALVEKVVRSLMFLTSLIRAQGATITRLRRLVGRRKNEKTSAVIPPKGPDDGGSGQPVLPGGGASSGKGSASDGSAPSKGVKAKGHGRLATAAYPDAEHRWVAHECLKVGDRCPGCAAGRLYAMPEPARFLQILGQAPLQALCWDCQRLRCSGCGAIYTARVPAQAQGDKYAPSAVGTLAVLHYGLGVPFHRLERLQADLATPVPASTQSELLKENVEFFRPVRDELERQAAQAWLFFVDDSGVRILALVGKRRAKLVASGGLERPERTGLHTTAIVAVTADGQKIALLYSGREHAGENLAKVLERRNPSLPPPLQMSDALACNTPGDHAVLECRCNSHARANFVAEVESFPEEVGYVLSKYAAVFKIDEECRQKGLSAEERLEVHQLRSGPIMDELKEWMTKAVAEKRIEPNSALGKAVSYMLKRWDALTAFLRIPGAPLDNNAAERLLKEAIIVRKNSLFFRNVNGAEVANVTMTLISTARLAGENPIAYLTALLENRRQVASNPAGWLPWTYRETLRRIKEASEPIRLAA